MAADEPFDYFEFAKEVTFAHARALLYGGPAGCLPLGRLDEREPKEAETDAGVDGGVASSAELAAPALPSRSSSRPVLYGIEDEQ